MNTESRILNPESRPRAISPRPAASAHNGTHPADTQLDNVNPPGAVLQPRRHGDTEPGEAEARQLTVMYREAQNGLRRVVALGLYCFEIKERLPHGKFLDWLKQCAPDLSFQQLQAYMGLTKDVLAACGFQISDASDICPGVSFLTLPEAEVPAEARPLRDKICELIDGKTFRQLRLQFRTPEGERHQQHGTRSAPKDGRVATTEEILAVRKKLAASDWIHIETCLKRDGVSFALLDDLEVHAQIAVLEAHLSARKRWVNTPVKKRDARAIEQFLADTNA